LEDIFVVANAAILDSLELIDLTGKNITQYIALGKEKLIEVSRKLTVNMQKKFYMSGYSSVRIEPR